LSQDRHCSCGGSAQILQVWSLASVGHDVVLRRANKNVQLMRGKVSLHLHYSANEMEVYERIIGSIRCSVKDHDRDIDVGLQRVNDLPSGPGMPSANGSEEGR
jgi:hypothetical protein